MTRAQKITYHLICILLLGSAVVHFYIPFYMGVDSPFLLFARQWLEGKKLYVDIFEVNPPLIMWINALPVYLAQHAKFMDDVHFFVVLALVTTVFAIWVSTQLITYHPAFADAQRKAQFTMLLCFVFVFGYGASAFFVRDHIFIVLAFPYMLRWSPSLCRAKIPLHLRLFTGLMAGIGFCIKPQCMTVFAGMQLLYLLEKYPAKVLISIENIIVCGMAAVYVAAIGYFTPEYFTVTVPMALATYAGYGDKIKGLVFATGPLVTLAVAFADFRIGYTSSYRRDIYYFLAMCLLLFAYALVNNGWNYHYEPLNSMALITCAWAWWEFIALSRQWPKFSSGLYGCAIVFAANALFDISYTGLKLSSGCARLDACRTSELLAAELKANHAHTFGAMFFESLYPLTAQSGASLELRFNFPWMMAPVIQNTKAVRNHPWIAEYITNALAEDLDRHKPEMVFVQSGPNVLNTRRHLDIPGYFKASAAFANAWRPYRYLHTINGCLATDTDTDCIYVYDVYRRGP